MNLQVSFYYKKINNFSSIFIYPESSMNWNVSSAPYGSAGILPISYMYIKMLGTDIMKATQLAILNANYCTKRILPHYPILFLANKQRCAHEFITDIREIKKNTGITEEDVAKKTHGLRLPCSYYVLACCRYYYDRAYRIRRQKGIR